MLQTIHNGANRVVLILVLKMMEELLVTGFTIVQGLSSYESIIQLF
jgi:hypothetical protein